METTTPDLTYEVATLLRAVGKAHHEAFIEAIAAAQADDGYIWTRIADEDYGRRILAYFAKKGISWTVWCFDPDWPPQMSGLTALTNSRVFPSS